MKRLIGLFTVLAAVVVPVSFAGAVTTAAPHAAVTGEYSVVCEFVPQPTPDFDHCH